MKMALWHTVADRAVASRKILSSLPCDENLSRSREIRSRESGHLRGCAGAPPFRETRSCLVRSDLARFHLASFDLASSDLKVRFAASAWVTSPSRPAMQVTGVGGGAGGGPGGGGAA